MDLNEAAYQLDDYWGLTPQEAFKRIMVLMAAIAWVVAETLEENPPPATVREALLKLEHRR